MLTNKTFIQRLIDYNTGQGTTVPTPPIEPPVEPPATEDAWRNEARALAVIALADCKAATDAVTRLLARLGDE